MWKWPGYSTTASQRWDFVRRNEVDIIVTDVRMSHMDGITLAKNVLESYPGVKSYLSAAMQMWDICVML